MEEITFTIAEGVKKYGNKAQKDAFKKNKGNLKPNQFNALIKTIEQHYEKVTVTGRGSKRIITCEGKLSKKNQKQRVDNRVNNGKELIGEFELKSLITSYILNQGNKPNSMSLTRWTIELGLSNVDLRNIVYESRYENLDKVKEHFKTEGLNVYTDKLIMNLMDDFADRELKQIKSAFHPHLTS